MHTIVVRKREGKRTLEGPRRRRDDNIKIKFLTNRVVVVNVSP